MMWLFPFLPLERKGGRGRLHLQGPNLCARRVPRKSFLRASWAGTTPGARWHLLPAACTARPERLRPQCMRANDDSILPTAHFFHHPSWWAPRPSMAGDAKPWGTHPWRKRRRGGKPAKGLTSKGWGEMACLFTLEGSLLPSPLGYPTWHQQQRKETDDRRVEVERGCAKAKGREGERSGALRGRGKNAVTRAVEPAKGSIRLVL